MFIIFYSGKVKSEENSIKSSSTMNPTDVRILWSDINDLRSVKVSSLSLEALKFPNSRLQEKANRTSEADFKVSEVRKKLSEEELKRVMAPRRPERAVTKNEALSSLRENRFCQSFVGSFGLPIS